MFAGYCWSLLRDGDWCPAGSDELSRLSFQSVREVWNRNDDVVRRSGDAGHRTIVASMACRDPGLDGLIARAIETHRAAGRTGPHLDRQLKLPWSRC